MLQESNKFWEEFGSVSGKELEEDEAAVNGYFSGFVFPGLSKYRKDFLFDKSKILTATSCTWPRRYSVQML